MKKDIMIVIFMMIASLAIEVKAQLVYESFGVSTSSQGDAQNQKQRTIAYFYAGGGNYRELPIIDSSKNGLSVIQYYHAPQNLVYESNGRRMNISPARVHTCYPDMSNNQLEKSFMFKASINGTVYYFGL